MLHTGSLGAQEARAGRVQVLDQPGLHSKIPFQKEKSHKQDGLFLSRRLPSSLLEPKVRGEGIDI